VAPAEALRTSASTERVVPGLTSCRCTGVTTTSSVLRGLRLSWTPTSPSQAAVEVTLVAGPRDQPWAPSVCGSVSMFSNVPVHKRSSPSRTDGDKVLAAASRTDHPDARRATVPPSRARSTTRGVGCAPVGRTAPGGCRRPGDPGVGPAAARAAASARTPTVGRGT
jgi:hypothetical protein